MLSQPIPRYLEVALACFGIQILGFLIMQLSGPWGFAVIAIAAVLGTVSVIRGLWGRIQSRDDSSNTVHPGHP